MARFGIQLWLEEYSYEELIKAWREVEDMGFESVTYFIPHFLFAKDLKAPQIFMEKVAPTLE